MFNHRVAICLLVIIGAAEISGVPEMWSVEIEHIGATNGWGPEMELLIHCASYTPAHKCSEGIVVIEKHPQADTYHKRKIKLTPGDNEKHIDNFAFNFTWPNTNCAVFLGYLQMRCMKLNGSLQITRLVLMRPHTEFAINLTQPEETEQMTKCSDGRNFFPTPICTPAQWQEWSECSEKCSGYNGRERSLWAMDRRILKRLKDNGTHIHYDAENCSMVQTTGSQPNWSSWSACSNSCGKELKTRQDQNKAACEQTTECTTAGDWSEWSECSVSCGNGTKMKTINGGCIVSAQCEVNETCDVKEQNRTATNYNGSNSGSDVLGLIKSSSYIWTLLFGCFLAPFLLTA